MASNPELEILREYTAKNFDEAIRELVFYIKACRAIGGVPMIRTGYASMPYRKEDYLGVLVLCYGRANVLPSMWIWAPEKDPKWRELVEKFKRMVGDYKYVLAEYGHLVPDEEVEAELRKLFPPEVIEALRKRPPIPAVRGPVV